MRKTEAEPHFMNQLLMLVKTSISLIGDFATLFKLELKLAQNSLIKLLILVSLSILFVISFLICVQGILFAYLISKGFTLLVTFSILAGIQLLILIILGLVAVYYSRHIDFAATRKQIHEMKAFTHELTKSNT
jgi:uncharacterized membrane protein YqjE